MAQERLPARLGRYEVREQIGAGGMGVVLRAFDPKLRRDVAIKLLSAHLGHEPMFAERFRREAMALARLTHPNVVRVYDAGQQDSRPYYVMELLDGRGLDLRTRETDDHWSPARDFDSNEFLDIFTPLADALCSVHAVVVLHRDIKPANLMLGVPERGAVLTDFGLARIEGAPGLTLEGEVMGTSRYIAPEQLTGAQATAASDVFGLGACMYEYATERVPFADIPVHTLLPARMHAELAPVARMAPRVPAAIAALIDRAVKTLPSERYSTAAELQRALVRIRSEGLDKTERNTVRIGRAPARTGAARDATPAAVPGNHRWGAWSLAGLACIAIALAWLGRPSPPRARTPAAAPIGPAAPASRRPAAPAPVLELPAGQAIDLGPPGQGPECGYAGPAVAHAAGRLMVAWVGPGSRVLVRSSADGGRTWTRPPLDGVLQSRTNQVFALTGIEDRFYLLYSVGAGVYSAESHCSLFAVWTSGEATAWSSPWPLGQVRDCGAVSMAAGRTAGGRARLLSVWQAPSPGGDREPSFTTAWGDAATGQWSMAELHECAGVSFDDPIALLTPSEGLVVGRLRQMIVGDLLVTRSSGPGSAWSPPAAGRFPGGGFDRKQAMGASDRERTYLAFRKPAREDGFSQVLVTSRNGFRTVELERLLPAPPRGARQSCRIAARDNRVFAVWEGVSPTPEYWSTSRDKGEHWTAPKLFAEFHCWHPAPSIDVDDSGRAWICWADEELRVRAMGLP
ncbi:MAG: protein kinase [Candidatus Wallbacteria bacterium]|nr:protein kinase [Candidatus Wallbacteria bacterium]